MRTASLLVVAAAAVANAGYTNGNGTYVCGRPNANYCLGGDIILRCDAYGHGTPGRCSDNVSGYPPLGGVSSCYEKDGSYGDASCEKNCVVYADPPYTLPPALCQPSYTSTSSTPESTTNVYSEHVPETTKPVYYNSTVPGEPSHTGEPVSYTTKCATYTYPNPTKSGESITKTITYTVPCYPTHGDNATATYNPPTNPPHTTFVPVTSEPAHNNGSCASCTGGNGGYGAGGNGGQNGGESATRLPVGPASTSTSGPETIPTGGAAANAVSGLLAAAGIAAAFLV
ncbi:hypothetical protein B0J13DRAFT_303571 [Dactylonectria estremocensis]|uniref:Uncharacterized protein n=1 Tax=Dactylonectria estremocensis TaxID=1079267 RepID=A0A9P9F023_9HYPO|nr:hypothetical protein B0J13DRAFT_303571 [Dactylonectria estremocensis]